MCRCILYSKFWTESARPSRPGSVQTWSKARALVSVNKREDFSPAGSLLQGLLHTPSTLCYSWSQILKITSDGEPCAYDDQGVSSIRPEPVCPNCWADLVCDHKHTHIHTYTHTHTHTHEWLNTCTCTHQLWRPRSPSLPHLCRNILKSLSHIIGLHFTGNSRYVPVVCVCVCSRVCILLFHPGRENCRQLNHKQSVASTNQVRRKRCFSQCAVLWHLRYTVLRRDENSGGVKKIKSQGASRLGGGQMEREGEWKREQRGESPMGGTAIPLLKGATCCIWRTITFSTLKRDSPIPQLKTHTFLLIFSTIHPSGMFCCMSAFAGI